MFFLSNENYVLFNYRYYIFLSSKSCKGNINGKDGSMSMHSGTSKGIGKVEKVDKQKLVNLISKILKLFWGNWSKDQSF